MLRKNHILPDLYNGHSGTHLTAYLPGVGSDPSAFREQVEKIIWKAESLLKKEQGADFTKKFLQPIYRLLRESHLLSNTNEGGWAIFRSPTSFRLKKVPVKIPKLSVVAKSFHVKPILKWAQKDKNCYVLSLTKDEAILFESSFGSLKYIASLPIPSDFYHNSAVNRLTEMQFKYALIDWIDDWIFDLEIDSSLPLVLAGEKIMTTTYRLSSRCSNLLRETIEGSFDLTNSKRLRRCLSRLMREAAGKEQKKVLKQLLGAERKGKAEFDLERIAKLAVRGEIKRLYVAEDHYVWGVLNKDDGSITIHPHQKNCQDDDILDDLAELVLKRDAEVVLLPSHQMPYKSSIAAIIEGRAQPFKTKALSNEQMVAA